MRPYILEETNWKQVKNQTYDLAVLPWGATEPHNYHLPYGTDSLETTAIANEAAQQAWEKGARVMVLPAVPFGVQNPGQIDLPFCLHINPSTQIMILRDIVRDLHRQGIRKLVLMNGHGGNDFKPAIREIVSEYPDMLIVLNEWFKMLELTSWFEDTGDHAGEMETSIILHYFPHLVLPLDEAGAGKAKSFRLKSLQNKSGWTPRKWDEVSEDTGVGNPAKATAEKGKKFLEAVTSQIAELFAELAQVNPGQLYEK